MSDSSPAMVAGFGSHSQRPGEGVAVAFQKHSSYMDTTQGGTIPAGGAVKSGTQAVSGILMISSVQGSSAFSTSLKLTLSRNGVKEAE